MDDELMDDLDDFQPADEDLIDPPVEGTEEPPKTGDEEDYITSLLKARGIEDKTKIKYENDEGVVEEVDWNSLSNEDKFNILSASDDDKDTGLDDTEIQLINAIRESGLSPSEYIQHIQQQGVDSYIQNNQTPTYTVDEYSDDELFIADFISRMGEVSDEEAQEALEKAKSNETLFTKQINAIRNEYKQIEEENLRQAQAEQELYNQQQYEQFSNKIIDEINNFTDFSGYDLNLDRDDMQELYDFITGTDAAGVNHFSKALSDPKTLVQTAWLVLNAKDMIENITEYFQREITNVRQQSYNKGKQDNKSDVVFKSKEKVESKNFYEDLDDF